VQAKIEQIGGNAMVRTGIGRAVRRLQPLHLPRHARRVAEGRRPVAQKLQRLVRQILRVPLIQIANSHQRDVVVIRSCQLSQSRQMPPPHPPAADYRQPNWLYHRFEISPSYS
jgi:hypothetical protein